MFLPSPLFKNCPKKVGFSLTFTGLKVSYLGTKFHTRVRRGSDYSYELAGYKI
jgi:hypothetical protein